MGGTFPRDEPSMSLEASMGKGAENLPIEPINREAALVSQLLFVHMILRIRKPAPIIALLCASFCPSAPPSPEHQPPPIQSLSFIKHQTVYLPHITICHE